MKTNRYRRLRAQETAHRNFLSGLTDPEHNPFPEGSLEARIYAQSMADSVAFHKETTMSYAAYGCAKDQPALRSPDTVTVRPALPGYP